MAYGFNLQIKLWYIPIKHINIKISNKWLILLEHKYIILFIYIAVLNFSKVKTEMWDKTRNPLRANRIKNSILINDLSQWCQYNIMFKINHNMFTSHLLLDGRYITARKNQRENLQVIDNKYKWWALQKYNS